MLLCGKIFRDTSGENSSAMAKRSMLEWLKRQMKESGVRSFNRMGDAGAFAFATAFSSERSLPKTRMGNDHYVE